MAVESYRETIEIPTYVLGPEDPNPPFQRRGYWDVYPYTMLDDIGETLRPVKYRALVLENEYLKVIVLPELGGHLYSALDKPTGQEIFYRNNVVKPGLIALRGAWISGGIEFNFPKGHTVTTVSPVDGRLVKDKDGSATAWVGNVEKRYRMSWAVGVRLRPGSSLLETEIRLSNRTALPHPYYFWANAAVPARFGMQMVYPCTRIRTWGGWHGWPTDQGRNMATYDAYEQACDVFAMNGWEDFFGVYYPDQEFGVVHVADVRESFGKKLFTWGTSEEGRTWSGILSDGDGPYCEIQSGRFVDQQTYRLFPPHHSMQWQEYWYAVKGTGGFAWANQEAAVRLETVGASVECGVLSTRALPGAKVRVRAGGRTVHERPADLAPDKPLRFAVDKQPGWEGPLSLAVLDPAGREVICYQEAQAPRTVPLREMPKPAEPPSVGDVLREAAASEEKGDPLAAREQYQRALDQDPACVAARLGLGRLATGSVPARAVELLSEAAALAPSNAEVSYFLGLALLRAGQAEEAVSELWKAAHAPEFAHAARVELGRLALAQADWRGAIELLSAAVRLTQDGVRARCLLAAALRRSGQPTAALAQLTALGEAAAIDRLVLVETHFSALAAGKASLAARQLNALLKLLPAEGDPWLELAFEYSGAGLPEEALRLLETGMAKVKAVAANPLVHYAAAAQQEEQGRRTEASEQRRIASALNPKLIFPYHYEMEGVLRHALAHGSDAAAPHHYLGLLLYAQNRREEALVEWERAAELGLPDHPTLYRNLGLASREVKQDLPGAEAWLRRAVASRPDDQRPYLELVEVLRAQRGSPEERLALLDRALPNVQRRGTVAAAQIDACLDLGLWDRALKEIGAHTFHRWEGEFSMRGLWVNINLGRGAARFDAGDYAGAAEDFRSALEYPANLRIGRHARRLDARSQWCLGSAYEALGDSESAKTHWTEASAEIPHYHGELADYYGTSRPDLIVYRSLALRKLGQAEEAEKELRDLAARLRDDAGPRDEVQAKFFLGLTLKALGEKAEAEAALRESLDRYPWNPRAQRLLASEVVL